MHITPIKNSSRSVVSLAKKVSNVNRQKVANLGTLSYPQNSSNSKMFSNARKVVVGAALAISSFLGLNSAQAANSSNNINDSVYDPIDTTALHSKTRQTITYAKGKIYQVKIEKMDKAGNVLGANIYTDNNRNGTVDVVSHFPKEGELGTTIKDMESGTYTIVDKSYKPKEKNKILMEGFEFYRPSIDSSDVAEKDLKELQKYRAKAHKAVEYMMPNRSVKILNFNQDSLKDFSVKVAYKYSQQNLENVTDISQVKDLQGKPASKSYSFEDTNGDGYLNTIDKAITYYSIPQNSASRPDKDYIENKAGNNPIMGDIEFSDLEETTYKGDGYKYLDMNFYSITRGNPVAPTYYFVGGEGKESESYVKKLYKILDDQGWPKDRYIADIYELQEQIDFINKNGYGNVYCEAKSTEVPPEMYAEVADIDNKYGTWQPDSEGELTFHKWLPADKQKKYLEKKLKKLLEEHPKFEPQFNIYPPGVAPRGKHAQTESEPLQLK